MTRRILALIQTGLVAAVLSSCLTEEDPADFRSPEQPAASCQPVSCTCPDGTGSERACRSDGTLAECDCAGGGAGAAGTAGTAGAGGGQAGEGGTGPTGGCTLFPDCDGCATCFQTCICQSDGDVPGCRDKCGGGGGSGGTGGGGGTCDPGSCPGTSLPVGMPCCTSDTNQCGLVINFLGPDCIERDQPGTPDPGCQGINLMGIQLDGCCRPDGACGVLDTFLGLGCVDPSAFGQPPARC